MSSIKKEVYKNIIISIIFRVLCLIVAIPSIRILINTLGSEANGINSLFMSIAGILSISELGISTAITFCMYKPIINKDYKEVNALYRLFSKLYKIIGVVYLIIGLIVSNFVHLFADVEDVNIKLLFILYLIPSAIGYLYQAKLSLFNAHKKNYIATTITSSILLLKFSLQIITLYYFKSFEVFYICYFISELCCLVITNVLVNKKYRYLINDKNEVDKETKNDIVRRIGALFFHKIGGLFVNTTDNIIISTFVSVVVLGMYSNYILIITSVTSILVLILTPLTSILGHLYVSSKEEAYKQYNYLYYINFIISFVILSGYFAIADDIIILLFGVSQEIASDITIVIAIAHFVTMMRKPTLVLRDATGLYTKDKYKPLIECSINFILSIILVQYFGVVGVLISTIITSLFICHIIEPFVLYKYGFNYKVKNYLIRNYVYITTFIINILILKSIIVDHNKPIVSLLINGTLSVLLSSIILFIIFLIDKQYRDNIKKLYMRGFKYEKSK